VATVHTRFWQHPEGKKALRRPTCRWEDNGNTVAYLPKAGAIETGVTRQPPARQRTGWVAITWEPQNTRTQQWYSNTETVFSMWPVPRCYKRDGLDELVSCKSAQLKYELWEDFVCHIWSNSVRLCYSSCIKIRCQETASEDCNRLRTLVSASVICKMQSRVVSE
jgi:hypothetical protein